MNPNKPLRVTMNPTGGEAIGTDILSLGGKIAEDFDVAYDVARNNLLARACWAHYRPCFFLDLATLRVFVKCPGVLATRAALWACLLPLL